MCWNNPEMAKRMAWKVHTFNMFNCSDIILQLSESSYKYFQLAEKSYKGLQVLKRKKSESCISNRFSQFISKHVP